MAPSHVSCPFSHTGLRIEQHSFLFVNTCWFTPIYVCLIDGPVLFQLPSQPGLQILSPDGKWSSVPINPTNLPTPPILLNIGDLLSYWTNGLLKSTVHRVIFPSTVNGEELKDRYSIAYFCHPADEAQLVAVPSAKVHERVGRSETDAVGYGGGAGNERDGDILTASDHLNRRLAATYGLKG
jgi:hypothetical protein